MSAPMRFFSWQGITWLCRRAAYQQSKAKYLGVQQLCTSSGSRQTDAATAKETHREFFRTSENDPANHTLQHEGQFYSLPMDQVKTILPVGASTKWRKQIQPFQEASIMVRRPALEVLDIMKAADYTNPPIKFVLYGRPGSGKTMSLSHVIHYCHNQGWLIVHIPSVHDMNYLYKYEYQENYGYKDTTPYECMYDQPSYASEWLTHFKERNHKILEELTTTEAIVWSKRESTEKGEPLMEVINQGLKRPKNSCDAVGVLLKELQTYCSQGKFRMLFAVKAVNGLFSNQTNIRKKGGYMIPVSELTLNMHFKKLLAGDWVNGAIVATVDTQNLRFEPRDDFKPLYLLKKQGFEFMDPFVPVFVDNYNEKEMESCIEYYIHKKWIQNESAMTDDGRKQLRFLTENSPGALNIMGASL